MDTATLVIFGLVYLGMILGEIPGLALDRTGVALLGAIGVVAIGREPLGGAWSGVDMAPGVTMMKPRAAAAAFDTVLVTVGAFAAVQVASVRSGLVQTFPAAPVATMRYVYVRPALSPSSSARWVVPLMSILPPPPRLSTVGAASFNVNSIRA